MSSIVYHIDKKTGNRFAYESVSFRDPVTKKPRTKKTYLGRVDPESGEIIPKGENGKRNRSMSTNQRQAISADSQRRIEELSNQVSILKRALSQAENRNDASGRLIKTISNAINRYYSETNESS